MEVVSMDRGVTEVGRASGPSGFRGRVGYLSKLFGFGLGSEIPAMFLVLVNVNELVVPL
jgi:hypothetical protein